MEIKNNSSYKVKFFSDKVPYIWLNTRKVLDRETEIEMKGSVFKNLTNKIYIQLGNLGNVNVVQNENSIILKSDLMTEDYVRFEYELIDKHNIKIKIISNGKFSLRKNMTDNTLTLYHKNVEVRKELMTKSKYFYTTKELFKILRQWSNEYEK